MCLLTWVLEMENQIDLLLKLAKFIAIRKGFRLENAYLLSWHIGTAAPSTTRPLRNLLPVSVDAAADRQTGTHNMVRDSFHSIVRRLVPARRTKRRVINFSLAPKARLGLLFYQVINGIFLINLTKGQLIREIHWIYFWSVQTRSWSINWFVG